TIAAASAAIAVAGSLGLRRLAAELRDGRCEAPIDAPGDAPVDAAIDAPADAPAGPSLTGGVVFLVWAIATLAIAGRLWWDLAVEVVS
ncbi:MAG TPA: hypothetical protein VFK02_10325, partial [Kofleriaceae bacterium]|nr:hypothetical protein [Kofleriaceae bacterium]